MLKKTLSKKSNVSELYTNRSATSFTDGFYIAKRDDNCILLRFISSLPEQQIENHRTVMINEDVKKFIDGLCDALDYYPVKKKGKRNH